ncbi:MAG: energy-coupling factor ABC transporter ATP-binding protein [Bacilli bacterium]
MALLSCKNVTFHYREKNTNIHELNCELFENDWICIIGTNGTGKSTFAKLLCGILFPSHGEIVLHDEVTLNKENAKQFHQSVGYLFQNPEHQFFCPTVEEDILFSAVQNGMDVAEREQRFTEIVESLQIASLLKKNVYEMSGGEKQFIALAGVLMTRPAVIIVDEASAMMDEQNSLLFFAVLKAMQKQYNFAVISISHTLDDLKYAKALWYFNENGMIQYDTLETLLNGAELPKFVFDTLPPLYQLQHLDKQCSVVFHTFEEWRQSDEN